MAKHLFGGPVEGGRRIPRGRRGNDPTAQLLLPAKTPRPHATPKKGLRPSPRFSECLFWGVFVGCLFGGLFQDSF